MAERASRITKDDADRLMVLFSHREQAWYLADPDTRKVWPDRFPVGEYPSVADVRWDLVDRAWGPDDLADSQEPSE